MSKQLKNSRNCEKVKNEKNNNRLKFRKFYLLESIRSKFKFCNGIKTK